MYYCYFCSTDIYRDDYSRSYSFCEQCNLRLLSLIGQLQNTINSNDSGGNDSVSSLNLFQVASDCLIRVKKVKELEEEEKDEIAYLGDFIDAFKERIQTDIQLLPGHDGSPVFAHSVVLATRSRIFKNMWDTDECLSSSEQPIPIPELNYEELETLIKFLYRGHLNEETLEKHVYSLSKAAHKYEIPYLAKVCEKQLIKSLNSNNALDALEISDSCSMLRLKELVFDIIVKNMGDIVDSAKYAAFAGSNIELNLQITKAFVHSKK